MKSKRVFWLGFFILGITSCVRVPDCDLAKAESSARCEKITSQAMDNRWLALGDGPKYKWWEEFKDPTLNNLIEESLRLSPTLQAAEARVQTATQIAFQKRAALFPEINFGGDSNWQHFAKEGFFRALAPTVPTVVNDVNLDLIFTYEFDIWGKYRDLFAAALGEAASQEAERKQVELILTTSIAYAYEELQFLMRKKQLLQKRETNRIAFEKIREKREIHALDTAIERLQSKTEILDLAALIAKLDQEIQLQIHQLKALVGVGQDQELDLQIQDFSSLVFSLPENLSLDLLSRRPDLIAQKALLESKAKEIDAAKTDFYPNINLRALVGLESIFWSQLFKGSSFSAVMDPAIHLPIFTAGRLKAHLKEKVATFNQAVFTYNDMILRASQQVCDSLTALIYLQKEIEIRRLSLEVNREQEKITQKRLDHAIEVQQTLLDRKNRVLDMEIVLAELEYGKQLAGILLIRALGGGYHE